MRETGPGSVAGQLEDLILDSTDVRDFLQELTEFTAKELSNTIPGIHAAITLRRRKRSTTAAASSPEAHFLDEIQQAHGQGPCIEAMNTARTVIVADTRDEPRWPGYCRVVAQRGYRSILGVPLTLDEGAKAALNLFAPEPNSFHGSAISICESYSCQAGRALRLAVRISSKQLLADDLKAAMETRTAIDTAVGMIMAQNRCTNEEAFNMLRRASANRNRKIHDLAEDLINTVSPGPATTHFEA
jgi:GAF domain-containing protein